MKNTNSQVLKKTFAVRFVLARFILARFTLVRFFLAAILVPALLIGSAFTFGGSNLQAQANGNSKQGFFAGFVYLSGFKVDSTKKVTTNITTTANAITGYRITGSSDATSIVANVDAIFYNTPFIGNYHYNGVGTLLKESCETGVTSVTADGRTYSYGTVALDSFDAGTSKGEGTSVTTTSDGPGTIVHSNQNLFPTGIRNDGDDTNYCFAYFFGDLSSDRTSITLSAYKGVSDDSEPTPTAVIVDPTAITSSKSDKLSGIGLQFGFRWEKWRASLTHFTGKGGDNELANTLVMADYFVNEGLFVGGGLASMKLTNGSASGSATSPAIQIGYKQKLTPNLSLNFGLTKYISGVSLKNSVTTNNTTTANVNTTPIVLRSFEETQTPDRGDSAVVGVSLIQFGFKQSITASYFVLPSTQMFDYDLRTPVTQVRSRTVYINEIQIPAGASETQTTATTETDAELKAPLVISLSFHLSF